MKDKGRGVDNKASDFHKKDTESKASNEDSKSCFLPKNDARDFRAGTLPSRGRRIRCSQERNPCCVKIRMFRPSLLGGKNRKYAKKCG